MRRRFLHAEIGVGRDYLRRTTLNARFLRSRYTVLDLLDISAGEADDRRLEAVRRDREAAAGAYFERVAPQWDRIRSLYVSESAVEAAITRAAGDGPFCMFFNRYCACGNR